MTTEAQTRRNRTPPKPNTILNVQIPEPMMDELRRLSEVHDRPLAREVRAALVAHIARETQKP